MKTHKILFLSLVLLAISSCSRKYTCQCNAIFTSEDTDDIYNEVSTEAKNREEADAYCDQFEVIDNQYVTKTCSAHRD